MKISVYQISNDFFEIVIDGVSSEGSLIAKGAHTQVLPTIQGLLQSSTLNFGEDGLNVVSDGQTIGTFQNENKWLLLEVIPLQKARIIKIEGGTTQTQLRTWKGSLNEVILALYNYIDAL